MKGYKAVKLTNKRPDLLLLYNIFRYRKVYIKEILGRNIEKPVISCTLGSSLSNTFVPPRFVHMLQRTLLLWTYRRSFSARQTCQTH